MRFEIWKRLTFIDRLCMSGIGRCPYWVGHTRASRQFNNELFHKWNKRPQKSYQLYWRLHKKEN